MSQTLSDREFMLLIFIANARGLHGQAAVQYTRLFTTSKITPRTGATRPPVVITYPTHPKKYEDGQNYDFLNEGGQL